MPDPIRYKKQSVYIEAKTTIGEKEEIIKFNALVDAEKYTNSTDKQKEAFLLQELQKLSPNFVSSITNTGSSFSYVNSDALKDFDYGNVLVELHIPYCIDIPTDYELEVLLSPDTGEKALIIPSKIWTQKARTDTQGSSDTDFFAEDRVLYFKSHTLVGPKVPLDPTEGWEHNYTGFNVQKIKDTNGRFRFTHLFIQFDLSTTKQALEKEATREPILEKAKDITFQVVNKLIDTYRFVTKQEHITRLGEVNVSMVYFIDLNKGFWFSQVNIQGAVMNRSKLEIDKIEQMLEEGKKPELYNLLLLDAQNSFNTRNYPLAVVQSFQALEIFVENFLVKEMIKNGKTEKEASDHLVEDNNWNTKTRLKELVKEVRGDTLQVKDKTLWDKWCTSYDTVRNQVIHKGKETTIIEVRSTLENNYKVIELLKSW